MRDGVARGRCGGLLQASRSGERRDLLGGGVTEFVDLRCEASGETFGLLGESGFHGSNHSGDVIEFHGEVRMKAPVLKEILEKQFPLFQSYWYQAVLSIL